MAVSSRGRTTEALLPQKWKERETSPERTKVWVEPSSSKLKAAERKVPVVYYLCRNGQLEQPHFMEVPLSSPEVGLYLRGNYVIITRNEKPAPSYESDYSDFNFLDFSVTQMSLTD